MVLLGCLETAMSAWWFLEQLSEGLAFCDSLRAPHRIPVQQLRFSSCPVFLAPDFLFFPLLWARKEVVFLNSSTPNRITSERKVHLCLT